MSTNQPFIEIVAGPNGTGKTTFAQAYFINKLKRRLPRVFDNFWKIYRPLCDDWTVMNNTAASPIVTMDNQQFDMLKSEEQAKFAKHFLKGRPHAFKK